MAYIFRGRLCGLICPECPEPLATFISDYYPHHNTQNVMA